MSASERRALASVARNTTDAAVLRRAQALLWLDKGVAAPEVARRLGVRCPSVGRWLQRFAQRGGPVADRLADAPRPGRPARLREQLDPLIDSLIGQDPRAHGYAATVWTASLLRKHLAGQHGVTASEASVRLAIDRLSLRWKGPRPQLARRSPTWRQAKGGASAAAARAPARCC